MPAVVFGGLHRKWPCCYPAPPGTAAAGKGAGVGAALAGACWCCCVGSRGAARTPFGERPAQVQMNPLAPAGAGGAAPPPAPPPGGAFSFGAPAAAGPLSRTPPALEFAVPAAPLAPLMSAKPGGAPPAASALGITGSKALLAAADAASKSARAAAADGSGDAAAPAYARSLGAAARGFAQADKGARLSAALRTWQGRNALTEVEAALMVQRRWKAFRAKNLLKQWVKICATDGDVFYKSKATGELVWDIPALPLFSAADKAAAERARVVAAAGGEVVHVDPATGDHFFVRDGRFFFLDKATKKPMAEGWRQFVDATDTWCACGGGNLVAHHAARTRNSHANPPPPPPPFPHPRRYVHMDGRTAWAPVWA